jgi:hypothetical protein
MSAAPPAESPWVVVVGGFLGAGKTTLLLAAARELERRGMRSAVVMNDQGEALVDSDLAARHGLPWGEVTGGCFCCRFSELVQAMDDLRRFSPDVILAEPVGSCTDISATTLRPLREYGERFRLAPFTVLVDPERARQMLLPDADANLRFLFTKQLEEADLVCFTKSDITSEYPALDGLSRHSIRAISAKTGAGVAAWLDEVLSGELSAGGHILDIDYTHYAAAEAALCWLNLQAEVCPETPVSPAALLGPLLDGLDRDFSADGISTVHLKAIVEATSGYVKAAVCGNGQEPVVEGNLDASPAEKHRLLLNLRAVGKADRVRTIVEANLERMRGTFHNLRISCFHPAAPSPERRMVGIR